MPTQLLQSVLLILKPDLHLLKFNKMHIDLRKKKSMIKVFPFWLVLFTVLFQSNSFAQPISGDGGHPSDTACTLNDTMKTNLLELTSGINYKISNKTKYTAGYGGNSGYPVVNHNVDSFWIVTRLSTTYNPRHSAPLTYTGTYLNIGDNPYLMKTTGTYLSGYWSIRDTAGNCFPPSNTDPGSNGWLSVYTDGGGQTIYGFDSLYDGFEFDRCFALCQSDSLTFHLRLLADDIVDSVMVDTQHLYVVPMSMATGTSEFACGYEVVINKTIAVKSGRHFFKVWARDILHGHIGLSVFGDVTATGNYLIKAKYDERCTAAYPTHPLGSTGINELNNASSISIFPNPTNGTFTVSLPESYGASTLEVFDCVGK